MAELAEAVVADPQLAEYGIGTVTNEELQDALTTYVKARFHEAYQSKMQLGIQQRCLRNLRANKCEYQPDEIGLLGPYNDVYMGIAALKARAAEAWLNDIILSNIDSPFSLTATTIPDLPKAQREYVIDTLLRELPTMGDVQQLRERATQLKTVAINIASGLAEKAVKRMSAKIQDQLDEGDWYIMYEKFIQDLTIYPTAFVRGPIVINKPQAQWSGDKYTVKDQAIPVSRPISPLDAYPSPTSTTTQDGQYFIERARLLIGDMHSLINTDGFDKPNVRKVINEYPEGFELNLFADAERDRLEDTNQGTLGPHQTIDTLIYNGKIPGKLLIEKGVLVDDPQKQYEAEIWVAGEYTIRAILTPDPLGLRPIDGVSYRTITGSIWGQSVIDLCYDINRVCNASARALVRNMSYSSGPIGEVVSDRIAEGQDPTDISPYKVALVGPDLSGSGQPAYHFHNVKSVAGELIAVFDRYLKQADDITGIPAYVLGNPAVAGAGRTLGGLSMLMSNAAKGIKNVQLSIDRRMIAPQAGRYYNYNMSTSDDDSIKSDAKVVARGATGLLQKELQQTKVTELLQLLTPYIQQWDQLPDGIKIMLREILKFTGLPVDEVIPDPNAQENIQDITRLLGAGNQAVALNRGTSTPVPLPPQSVPPINAPLSTRPAVMPASMGA